jgi:Cof subfamily protein (haloacid dehalogenase superfamily)
MIRRVNLPRIVAVDLDGTLLRTDHTVSDRTRAALRLAEAHGARVVAVTARPPRVLDEIAEQAGLTGVTICSNGAMRYDLASGEVTIVHPLTVEVAVAAAAALLAALPEATFGVETGYEVVNERGFPHRSRFDWRFQVVETVADIWPRATTMVKLLARVDAARTDEALALARIAIGALAEITHSGGGGLLEVSAIGATKGGGLAAYAAELGVPASQVIAFGDAANDLPMLLWAGAGYAVANAHPLVLAQAPHRTGSNDDDGVATVLEQLFGGVR